ncbi:MAG TPA: S-layer homology domain-containing protein [Symbiobacteriaceae bacterium]|nr:S-layer homology domain-containing protein [Symbiobacteriaceae bacterium]
MRRIITSFLAALFMLAAAWPAPAAGAALTDMQGHWARTQVEAGISAGYVAGYPDGTFRPDAPITRAEFFKLLGSAMRLEPGSGATDFQEENRAPVHWSFAQGHIPAAVSSGLLFPPDYDNALAPDTKITRREIVMAAVRALGKEALLGRPDPALNTPDWRQYPDWLQEYAALAVGAGIVTGYEDGSLGLERSATRAEALVMVQRILNKVTVGLTSEAGPGNPTAVRHPAEGEPTWSWHENAAERITITNGTADQDYAFAEEVSELALRPAPGRALWVLYRAGSAGVVARLHKGQLTEVARYEGRTPELLAVDDNGRLWFSDGTAGLLVAGADASAAVVAGVTDRLRSGSIDWSGHFWGVGGSRVYRVTADLETVAYPLEMQPDQQVDYSVLADDGSLWLLLKGAPGGGAKMEAVHMELGRVTHRIALLGKYFGGVGSDVRVQVTGRSGPFLWIDTRVTAPGLAERSGGLYAMSLATGEFTRLVLPREVSTSVQAVSAADGGALVTDGAGRYWRLLP